MQTLGRPKEHHGNNCSDLSFKRLFSHVAAHQEDTKKWEDLLRPAQLNCGCDERAKEELVWGVDLEEIPAQRQFPMEPIALFVDGTKVTTESGALIRYAAHRKEAREVFHDQNILTPEAFDEVAWPEVSRTLHDVPKMFPIFACKQVFSVSATFHFLNKRDESVSPMCPLCGVCGETAGQILTCGEEGRVEALTKLSDRMMAWLLESGIDRDLIVFLIIKFIREMGRSSMEDICLAHSLPTEYLKFARSQDLIGWRRFLEGMISKRISNLLVRRGGNKEGIDHHKWLQQCITHLLEITHGLWIYRNIAVHDKLSGFYSTQGRERLQRELELQMERGGEDLCEEDKWLLEVNLSDLNKSSGKREAYWLMAMDLARAKFQARRRMEASTLPRGVQHEEELG